MKEWMAWILLIMGVSIIIIFAWWLTMKLETLTSIYITIVLNFIVSVYLSFQKYNK